MKTFSKADSTSWSYNLYKITEIVKATIPTYKINQLHERYNEVLVKKEELTTEEKKGDMKALNLI